MGYNNHKTAYSTAYRGARRRAATPVAPPPVNFIAAIRRRLLADAWFVGHLPGNLWNNAIPANQPNPAAFLKQIPIGRDPTGFNYIETGLLQFSVYGLDPVTPIALQDRAAQLITYPANLAGVPIPQLRWVGGYCMQLRPNNPVPQPPPEPGPRGAKVYGAIRQYSYTLSAGYT